MAKTLSQIRDDSRQIIFQTDSGSSHFSDTQLNIWANDGYRRIAVAVRSIPITNRDYTAATGEITLNAQAITVDSARVYNNATSKYEKLEVITIDRLMQIDADFENATAGKPMYLARVGTLSVRLHPPPDSDVSGQTLRVTGLESPTPLSADGDKPDLPENLHDLIPNWVAQRALFAIGRTEEAVAQLSLFRSGLKEMKGVSREFSRHRRQFTYPPGASDL